MTKFITRVIVTISVTGLLAVVHNADLDTDELHTKAPKPNIFYGPIYVLGETFSLNCTIPYLNAAVHLDWDYPGKGSVTNIEIISNENDLAPNSDVLYKNITVINATEENEGTYYCRSFSADDKNGDSRTKRLVEPFIKMTNLESKPIPVKEKQKSFMKFFIYDAYPPITSWSLYKDDRKLPVEALPEKYAVVPNKKSINVYIKDIVITDTGIYRLTVSNGYLNVSGSVEIRVTGNPIAHIVPECEKCLIDKQVKIECTVIGYPLYPVKWDFSEKEYVTILKNHAKKDSLYNQTGIIEVSLQGSTQVTCISGNATDVKNIFVYAVPGGFQIKDKEKTWYPQNQPLLKECVASRYDFTRVYWKRSDGAELDGLTEYSENSLSYYATLKIEHIDVDQAGVYWCVGVRDDGTEEMQSINITVPEKKQPYIEDSENPKDIYIYQYKSAQLNCFVDAIPLPQIEWYKDDVLISKNTSDVSIVTVNLNRTLVNSTLYIKEVQENSKYVCNAKSDDATKIKTFNIVLEGKIYTTIIIVTVVVIVVLFVVMMYLIWKIRKEKQFKRELKAIGLYFFKNGVPKSINPDLFIDEQAELLPYDEKFEFPFDKLTLGKQLGAGAFGVVYKAEARGIIDAEKTTTVAVKMVKKTADNMYIKALASELKIMVHLGKHVNIVNLLGACTKNIARRELIVIVEYCKFGNIHNYLQRHREVFIDQLTDSKENQFGKINRGFSSSSGHSGMQSEYCSSNHTQLTDHTFLNNTANTNRSSGKISETGYILTEPTYDSEGSFLRSLCTRDLLCWAFQIARGMEYLASRKVLHGDLAARNILLAEDNVVKICDFGLAKSVYKNDEYLKKGDGLLPVKWLAIECMTDRIFSTQSDVWAFGIVLWELFSLAKTPYPHIRLENVLQWLQQGNRLEKPPHADDRLYEVMKSCWETKPAMRPTFSQLQETLGSFLEDNVRNHYIDLNAINVDLNKKSEGQEDYLAMVCAPDYNIMVAPSPHHYINGNVAQIQLQYDGEGYLQMSPASAQAIFSPRPQGTKFDFDMKKMTPSPLEANGHESELTPMLPINRLTPINGSESDVECNLSPSPNPCPRIEEETDDVFENMQNNVKNIHETTLTATNPTYITFDNFSLDKKSQNNVNNYVNVPNGVIS